MGADDNSAGPNGVDEQRRKILKLTLGSGVAFATPLMVSFNMDGLSHGSEAIAQTYDCRTDIEDPVGKATAELDGDGNLLVTVSVANCADESLLIEISADVEAVYGCRNRGGKFPSGRALQRVAEDTVSNSTTLELHDNLKAQVTLTLATPELPESLGCPPPLEPGLKEVTYSNITGTITTEKVRYVPFSVVPEELSATF